MPPTAHLGLLDLSQEQPNWIAAHFPQSSNNKDQMYEFIHSFSLQWRLKAFFFPGDFVPNGRQIYIVTVRVTGKQLECQWYHYSKAFTLCNQHLLQKTFSVTKIGFLKSLNLSFELLIYCSLVDLLGSKMWKLGGGDLFNLACR